MKRVATWMVGVGLLLILASLTWRAVTPLPVWGAGEKKCTLASYKGRYVFAGGGKFSAIAGLEVYNGDGTMNGIYSQSTDGKIVRNIAYTGTYTVNPNCSSPLTITETVSREVVHYDQFIGPSGEEFTWVQTDPGSVSAGFERRVK